MRGELALIETAMAKLPVITGNGSKIVAINSGATALESISSLTVGQGGTGATTLTDGGVLLGSGTGAITAMAVLADSEMLVGDGATDPVVESGATLRTSIGVGTGDNVTHTAITATGLFTGVDLTATTARTTTDMVTLTGNTLTTGNLIKATNTISGSSLANRSAGNNLVDIDISRTDTRTSGTTADDFDLMSLKRTNVTTGSGGTLTAAGSVVKLENVRTETDGTNTDSVHVLELVQDTGSTGGALIMDGVMYIKEQAAAQADVADYGQIWVNTATPNELYFTDDAGNDFHLQSFTTGDVKFTYKTSADTGFVLCDDGSIGNASSSGSNRANADTEDLFTLLWNNMTDSECPVSSGRGGSAAADFSANKNLTIPLTLGRAIGIAGSGSGLTARILGDTVGEETHAQITAELASHAHNITVEANTSAAAFVNAGSVGGGTFTATSQSEGSGTAFNVVQPTTFMNVMIKL